MYVMSVYGIPSIGNVYTGVHKGIYVCTLKCLGGYHIHIFLYALLYTHSMESRKGRNPILKINILKSSKLRCLSSIGDYYGKNKITECPVRLSITFPILSVYNKHSGHKWQERQLNVR